jgi:hypothetical protein
MEVVIYFNGLLNNAVYTSHLIERRLDKCTLQLRKAFLEAVQLF